MALFDNTANQRAPGTSLIFGRRIFFSFRRETDKSVLIKLHGKKEKSKIVCSFNGIPITCRLGMEFFSHNQK